MPSAADSSPSGRGWAPASALWSLRVVWVGLAVVGSLAIADATEGRGAPAGTVTAVSWWLVVGVVLVATLVPGVLSLAVVRMSAILGVGASAVTLATGASPTLGGAMAALAVATTAVALSAEAGEAFVQGSAYGAEVRFPLRPPAALVPAAVVSTLLWVATVVSAVVLLADRQWALGVAIAALGCASTWWVLRAHVRLGRRWLVLVPAGLVVHDEAILGETLMVQRTNLRMVRLALADTQAADLTGPCGGHALEVTVGEMELAVLRSMPGRPQGGAIHVQSFLVAPSRPGRVLRAIADRRMPTS